VGGPPHEIAVVCSAVGHGGFIKHGGMGTQGYQDIGACADSYTEERRAGGPPRVTVRLAIGHGGCTDFPARSGARVDRCAMSFRARDDWLRYGTWGHLTWVYSDLENLPTPARRRGARAHHRVCEFTSHWHTRLAPTLRSNGARADRCAMSLGFTLVRSASLYMGRGLCCVDMGLMAHGGLWDRGAIWDLGLVWDTGAYTICRLCDTDSLHTGNNVQLETSFPASARRSSAG
jgi:hypothetical protein